MKIRLSKLPRSVAPAVLLVGVLFLGAARESIAQLITINFDSVNATTPLDPTSYLASFGITLSNVTASNPQIYSDQAFYNSTTVQASSGHNFLGQQSASQGGGGSYTLNFSSPVDNLSFTEIKNISANSIGTWSATAYAGATEVSSVGASQETGSFTTTPYTLSGTGITSLVISANGPGAGIPSVLIDDLTYSASAIPEPSTYAPITALGVLGFAAYRRRRRRAG